jgi:hypothetical protein
VVAFAQHVDVNVVALLEVVRGYHRNPARREELRLQCFDIGLGVFPWPIERVAADVNAPDAFDEIVDRGAVVAAIVADGTARETQQRRVERDVDRLTRLLRQGGEIGQLQAAGIRRGGEIALQSPRSKFGQWPRARCQESGFSSCATAERTMLMLSLAMLSACRS